MRPLELFRYVSDVFWRTEFLGQVYSYNLVIFGINVANIFNSYRRLKKIEVSPTIAQYGCIHFRLINFSFKIHLIR